DSLTQNTSIDLPDVIDTSNDNDQETEPDTSDENNDNKSDSSEVNSKEYQDDNDIKGISFSGFNASENVYGNDNAPEVPIIDYNKDSNWIVL
ncbi:14415_t:CDS:2, partial [Funneliformis mosseae]